MAKTIVRDNAGLCQCGCGERVPLARQTSTDRGHIKGQYLRFIHGHNSRGKNNPGWQGGRTKTSHGYILVLKPEHPRAFSTGYIYEHILIAEQALGHSLPLKAQVHHVDGVKHRNQNNLVICEDNAYHHLLHRRTAAFKATGSVHALKCHVCKQWGFRDQDNMNVAIRTDGKLGNPYHRKCANK